MHKEIIKRLGNNPKALSNARLIRPPDLPLSWTSRETTSFVPLQHNLRRLK